MLVSLPVLFTTLLGGYVLGFVFAALKLPLPVPPFAGLIAAAACLGGSESFELIRQNWLSRMIEGQTRCPGNHSDHDRPGSWPWRNNAWLMDANNSIGSTITKPTADGVGQ